MPTPPPTVRRREGIRWTPGTIRVILTNRAYRGVIVFKPRSLRDAQERELRRFTHKKDQRAEWAKHWIIVEGAHRPIVDQRTFDAAQRRITEAHKPRRWSHAKQPYWLSGLMTCETCGGPVVGGGGARRDGKGTRFYRCTAGNGYRGQCRDPLLSANATMLHEQVSRLLQDHVTTLLKTGALAKALDRVLGGKTTNSTEALERERTQLRAQLKELGLAVSRKVIPDDVAQETAATSRVRWRGSTASWPKPPCSRPRMIGRG